MPSRPGRVVVFFDKRTRLELVLQHNGLALASLPGGTPVAYLRNAQRLRPDLP